MTTLNLEEKIEGMMEKMGDIWRCVVCGKVASDSKARGNLKRHVETHLEGISHPCDICGHTSTSSGGLYQHKAKKHSDLRPDKVFKRKKLAMNTMLGGYPDPLLAPHHNGNSIDMEVVEQKVNALIEKRGEMLTCTPCGKTMPLEKKWAIRRHAEVHLEGMSFPCDTCGKVSKSSHGLYQHKAKQHPWLRQIQQENAKYKCNICGKASKTSKGLSNHKWKYHRPNTATKTVPYIPNGSNLSSTTTLAVKYESNGSNTVNVKFETSSGNLDVKYEPQDTADSLMSGDESSEAGDDRGRM